MLRKDGKAEDASDTAQLISRQIRHADNARFLRRLPGFELQRELPSQLVDLLCNLQDTEGTYGGHGMRRQEDTR
ncbi:hypothetical protein [Chelativorans sp. AA-79]|uniref:hypothetical protein n=1 Tax=Chelativorans sp. AA-79 TaxID=3028735 RepID=UPI0023F8EDA5|nr:hypothetical protein [Chelativorans sp. AA-79]WEX09332.1 hypothetical protein PVE73_25490 [Chelativorans sp. AA-79]